MKHGIRKENKILMIWVMTVAIRFVDGWLIMIC
jgi:hypothetical protein